MIFTWLTKFLFVVIFLFELVSIPIVTSLLLWVTFEVGLTTSGGIRGAVFNFTISFSLAMVNVEAGGLKFSIVAGCDIPLKFKEIIIAFSWHLHSVFVFKKTMSVSQKQTNKQTNKKTATTSITQVQRFMDGDLRTCTLLWYDQKVCNNSQNRPNRNSIWAVGSTTLIRTE